MSIYKGINPSSVNVYEVETHKLFELSSSDVGISSIQYRSASKQSDNRTFTESGSYWNSLLVNFYLSGSDRNISSSFTGHDFGLQDTSNPQHKNKFHSSGSVVFIPQYYFGEKIQRKTFSLTSGGITLKDDGYGNLYSTTLTHTSSADTSISSSLNYKGNVFYNKGVVTITDTGSYSPSLWNLSATTLETSSSAMTSQNNLPHGIHFKPDGTRFYMIGSQGSKEGVYEYSMTTAWDVSTATYTGNSLNLAPHFVADAWRSISFKPDGTKLFLTNEDNDTIKAWDLDIAWDLTSFDEDDYGSLETFALDGASAIVENKVKGHYFREDGLKLYIVGETNNSAIEYNLSSAFDLTSITGNTSQSYDISSSVSPVETEINGIHFKPDGTRMYTGGNDNNVVYEHRLSTAWDVSTATFHTSKSINAQDTQIHDVKWKPDGTKMYITGHGSDKVHQYNIESTKYTDLTTGSFNINFKSTHTVFTSEHVIVVNPGEFNSTSNPTARRSISSSINNYESPLYASNLTSSNWNPIMNTIGFYRDDTKYPTMVARYSQPIQMRDDITLIFKVRMDF